MGKLAKTPAWGLALLALLGCGRAAGVLLDIPDRPSPQPAQASAPPLSAAVQFRAEDTLPPPPIEAVMDRDSVLALLPRDNAGNVDWSAAIRQDVVRPRRGMPGSPPRSASGFEYDFVFGDFEVVFPHSSHVAWDGCKSCHPTLFPRPGQKITMEAINGGEACGRCHGTVAFSPSTCERCHPSLEMPGGREEAKLMGDLVLARAQETLGAGSYPPSIFPHWVHRIRYTCDTCHPEPFPARAGASVLTMADLEGGRSCGSCHDGGTAFGILDCDRCHRPPDGESGG